MTKRKGMGILQSRCRPGALVGLLCAAALVVTGCGAERDTPRPVAAGPSVLPHSMKGYELYSWQEGKEWHFTLITGTNRLKIYQEIVSSENVVTESDWVKISAQGIEDLRAVLNRLPEGETVIWKSGRRLEGVGAANGSMQMPDPGTIEEIERYCRRLGVRLQVAT